MAAARPAEGLARTRPPGLHSFAAPAIEAWASATQDAKPVSGKDQSQDR
jgi:hypothetical protein